MMESKKRLIGRIYNTQVLRSRNKNMLLPDYTLGQFRIWMLNNETFNTLYDKWIESGCKKELIPSVDRDDSGKPYSFSNITVMTWKDNDLKGIKERSIKVYMYDLDLNLINEFNSVSEAAIKTGISRTAIKNCLNARSNTSGGYKWKYYLIEALVA